jgi:hypothetical protein
MTARLLGKEKVPRYQKRTDLMNAVRAECAGDYEALFGRPWSESSSKAWSVWLQEVQKADAVAWGALSQLVGGLRAAIGFYREHPKGMEVRRGLRLHSILGNGFSEMGLYFDVDTLPPEAPPALRSRATSTDPIRAWSVPGAHLATDYDFRLAWTDEAVGESTQSSVPIVPIELSCSCSLGLSAIGLLLHSDLVRPQVEELAAALAPLGDGSRRQRAAWAARLAVVTRWDRSYARHELRRRRGREPSADRLTPTELAEISILCGNMPSLGDKPRTVGAVIDIEVKHIDGARQTLQFLRAAKVPIPRMYDDQDT